MCYNGTDKAITFVVVCEFKTFKAKIHTLLHIVSYWFSTDAF
jgi:hypothetical protein